MSCLRGRGHIMSIGRINCDTNAVSPKLTTAPSSTFDVATSRLKNPLQTSVKMQLLWGQLWLLIKTRSASKPRRYVSWLRMSLRMLTEDSRKKFQKSVSKVSSWTTTTSQPPRTLSQARQQPRSLVSGQHQPFSLGGQTWTAVTPKVYGGNTIGRKFLRWRIYLSSVWNSLRNGWGVFWSQQPTRKLQGTALPCRSSMYIFGMPLLHRMLWGNIWPEIVVFPITGINSGRTPLPDAQLHGPPTVHINYLHHEVYKQAFYFIFG